MPRLPLLALCVLLSACGPFRARPDLRISTMTLPEQSDTCIRGFKARSNGTIGQYDTKVVEVSNDPCVPSAKASP